MNTQYSELKKEVSRPGDSTKRIVVFLFGLLLAMLGILAAATKHLGIAAILGALAVLFFGIGLWGNRKTVAVAKEFTDITTLP